MVDKKKLIDHLLETGNLTDNLEDKDAIYLIDWGVNQLDTILNGLDDMEVAEQRVGALMRGMRIINRIAGDMSDVEPDQLAELLENYIASYGIEHPAIEVDYQSVIYSIADMNIRQAIEFLVNWCSSITITK